MTALLAAEWIKLRHRWMPRVLILLMLCILALLFWGTATQATERPDLVMPHSWISSLVFAAFVAPFLWPVLGGSWAGNEYGWGTIRLVLSRRPNRVQFVLAGLAILALFVAVSLLITILFSCLAGIVVALVTGRDIFLSGALSGSFFVALLKEFLASWYVLLFYLAISYAAGTLFRSGAVGIGVGIGITLADLIIGGIFQGLGGHWRDVALHFPGNYTRTLPALVAQGTLSPRFVDIPSGSPSVGQCIIALALYIVVPVVIALALIRVRDITS
jgi:ABC-type transport system involved in multi-copper enzyme maturation permease subunit